MYRRLTGKTMGIIICAGLMMIPALSWGQNNTYVLNLDGIGDYVSAGDNDNLTDFTDGSFTIQAWVFVHTLSFNHPIVSKWAEAGDQRSWVLYVTNAGKLLAFISSDGTDANTDVWATNSAVVSSDQWHHIAFVCDPNGADKIKFYADNVEYSHTSPSVDPPNAQYNSTSEMWVGRRNTEYLYGYIDELRITDDVLTSFPDEIIDFPLTANSDTEVLYNFDNAVGDIEDQATIGGNPANDGTLQGDAARTSWNSLGPGNDLPLPVTLVSISAFGADQMVTVSWSTESEYDNLGFHVYRSLNTLNGYARITADLIPSQGFTPATQYYNYADNRDLVNGVTYHYRISDIDVNGNERTHQLIATATPMAENFLPGENSELAGYQLSQNYPNPFNNATTIRYYVRDGGDIKLSVYNVNGDEIKVLVEGTQDAGEYFQEFDATSLPTGIYFVRLAGENGYDNIKKMLFLK